MLVVVVVGILAAMVTPSLGRMLEKSRIQAAANVIKHQLITARVKAIAEPTIHCGVYLNNTVNPQRTLIFFDRGTAYQYNSATDSTLIGVNILPPGITMSLTSVTNRVIVFRGDGSAKTGGTITVRGRFGISRRINVLPSTGRIKVL
jgi:Tfp pilus assembly protein FimT